MAKRERRTDSRRRYSRKGKKPGGNRHEDKSIRKSQGETGAKIVLNRVLNKAGNMEEGHIWIKD